jgi:hypothetical protein
MQASGFCMGQTDLASMRLQLGQITRSVSRPQNFASSDGIPNDSLPIYHLRGNVSKYRTPDERKTYTDPINDGR